MISAGLATILALLSTRIVLQFDGSSQLLGVRHSSRSRSSSSGEDIGRTRISTCAAILFVNGRLQGLGGRHLLPRTGQQEQWGGENGPSWSSAIVEYEGLLYGLEQLVEYYNNKHLENDEPDDEPMTTIVVQGDCKAVMAQMQGRARPRKMDLYHQRARDVLLFLKESFFSRRNNGNIVLEHIPREQNALADELAQCIAVQCQRMAIQEFLDRLNLLPNCPKTSFSNNTKNKKNLLTVTEILQPLSCLDVPTNLVGLEGLAHRLYQNHDCSTNLMNVLDRMERLLRSSDASHTLYHVEEAFKRDMAVKLYLYRRQVYQECGGQAQQQQQQQFHRRTRHFLRSHADHITRLEATFLQPQQQQPSLLIDSSMEKEVSKQKIETNLWSSSGLHDKVWTSPIQHWLNDAITTSQKPSWQREWSHWSTVD